MAEACYKPKYLTGSFKGVSFKVEDASSEHGRRGAEGEFPFGEVTGYADLGRKIRTYKISARFDGNDHILRAAALIAVCEAKGSGILVHPTRGVILSAACRSLTVTDKPEESGGVTEVELDLVEANNWPNGLSLFGQLLGLLLGPLLTASRESFRSSYALATIQPFRVPAVVAAAQGQVLNIAGEYQNATTAKAADLARNRIINDLQRVAADPTMAANTNTMDRALSLGLQAIAMETSGVQKFDTFRRIANVSAKQSTFPAPAGVAENAVYSNVRAISAAYMAEGIYESEGMSNQEIFAKIDVVDAVLTQEMAAARALCDDALFLALSTFKTDTLAQLYDLAYNSPGQVIYKFGGSVHPVVAAYSIFGDAKRHRELETMNAISVSGRIGPAVAGARGIN